MAQLQQIVKEVEIPHALRDYVEKLHSKVQSARDIIAFMISGNMLLETETGEKYQREFSEAVTKYEDAKQQLTEKYIPEEFKTAEFTWTFDFRKSALVVSKVR